MNHLSDLIIDTLIAVCVISLVADLLYQLLWRLRPRRIVTVNWWMAEPYLKGWALCRWKECGGSGYTDYPETWEPYYTFDLIQLWGFRVAVQQIGHTAAWHKRFDWIGMRP